MANKERFYPNVHSVEEAQSAIHQAFDHLYTLRDQMDEAHMKLTAHNARIGAVEKRPTQEFTNDLCGIKINATTDSAGLQNGFTVRFNSATGQFDFGV